MKKRQGLEDERGQGISNLRERNDPCQLVASKFLYCRHIERAEVRHGCLDATPSGPPERRRVGYRGAREGTRSWYEALWSPLAVYGGIGNYVSGNLELAFTGGTDGTTRILPSLSSSSSPLTRRQAKKALASS